MKHTACKKIVNFRSVCIEWELAQEWVKILNPKYEKNEPFMRCYMQSCRYKCDKFELWLKHEILQLKFHLNVQVPKKRCCFGMFNCCVSEWNRFPRIFLYQAHFPRFHWRKLSIESCVSFDIWSEEVWFDRALDDYNWKPQFHAEKVSFNEE